MTAAHCIEGKATNLRIVFSNELMNTVNAREVDIQQNFVRHGVAQIIHPEYSDAINEKKDVDWHDIALIKFSGTVPEGYKPATFLTDEASLVKGALVTLAGYGVTQVTTDEIDVKKHKNIDSEIESGDIVCDDEIAKTHCYAISFDGDDELYETKAPLEGTSDLEVRLDESEHGTCVGDSGGPAYIEKDGAYYLFGITSRGSLACDGSGVYTNAVKFKSWIEDSTKKLNGESI